MLLNAVATRLPSLSPECLQTVFSLLPSSEVSLRFQVSLCQACLGHASDSGQRSRPRPQARNVPRAAPSRNVDDTQPAESTPSLDASTSSTFIRKFPPLQHKDILQIFSTPLSSSDGDPPAILRKLHLKFTLISAAGELQRRMAPEERDPEWINLLQEGQLAEAIGVAFSLTGVPTMRPADHELAEDLKTMLSLVSLEWCRPKTSGDN